MEWKIESKLIEYSSALAEMKNRVEQITSSAAEELVWILEHYDVYTAGSSAVESDLINPNNFPIFYVGRGGKFTYHGPEQRVAYILLDLKKRNFCDLKMYIYNLEEIIIKTLQKIGLDSFRKKDYIGIWVETTTGIKKIAAIGVRIKKWVTYHGVAVNINPDLSAYLGIVPCGVKDFGVTSLTEMGYFISTDQFDSYFRKSFEEIFGKD